MRNRNTHDAFHIAQQEEMVCSAVVYPSSTEEVQTIVFWANKHIIPIYPISMGRNIGYGGAAPRVPGSVVVDLGRRMNKVLRINGSSASCMVEPGVSYYKLYEEVQKTGLPLWIDCPDLGGGSVMGNALDRGIGLVTISLEDFVLALTILDILHMETISLSIVEWRLSCRTASCYELVWVRSRERMALITPYGSPSSLLLVHIATEYSVRVTMALLRRWGSGSCQLLDTRRTW